MTLECKVLNSCRLKCQWVGNTEVQRAKWKDGGKKLRKVGGGKEVEEEDDMAARVRRKYWG